MLCQGTGHPRRRACDLCDDVERQHHIGLGATELPNLEADHFGAIQQRLVQVNAAIVIDRIDQTLVESSVPPRGVISCVSVG